VNRTIAAWLILIGPALFLGAGCSRSGVRKVNGQVLLDGKAVAGADVRFVPKSDPSLGEFGGQTQEDGKFSCNVSDQGMTARPGKFVVVITRGTIPGMPATKTSPKTDEELREAMKGTAPGLSNRGLPPQYADPKTTPFEVEIKAGVTDLEPFRLSSNP
jgi:hypothetical protein